MGTRTVSQKASSSLLTGAQLAERLALHPGTVRRLRREGKISGIVLNSRTVRYEPSEVERLIQEGRVLVTPAGGAR